jgi:uncharacterized protein (TIGR02145 family)
MNQKTIMNNLKIFRIISEIILFMFVFVSCVNDIEKKEQYNSNIPIQLTTKIQLSHTRTIDNSFEYNDAIGLYVIRHPSTLRGNRYVNNVKFSCSASLEFVPESPVFYPESSSLCDFIAYYPYKNAGIEVGETSFEVNVQRDQSNANAFSLSDFLVAESPGLSSSNERVDLIFQHKLSCFNIHIKAGDGFTVNELLELSPVVRITNTNTQAVYDFATGLFVNQNTLAEINLNGEWKINDDMLSGKRAIIIPQTLHSSSVLMEVEISGISYDCRLTEDFTVESGSSNDFILTVSPYQENLSADIVIGINNWEERNSYNLDAVGVSSGIFIPGLTFRESSVYKVTNNSHQLAEICKEYLCMEGVKFQAIVVYPVKEGKPEVSNGLVVRVIDNDGNVHGGKLSWNVSTNTPTYMDGNYAPIDYIYVTSSGEIVTSRNGDVLQLRVQPYTLVDDRNKEITVYPIVKIGMQYWMAENLKTSRYIDGSSIELGENGFDIFSQLHCIRNGSYYYNLEALNSGKLSPVGWKIANDDAWQTLENYIGGNVSVLKSTSDWKVFESYLATNLSGFNAFPVGFYDKTYLHENKYVGFWSMKDDDSNIVSKSVTLGFDSDRLGEGSDKRDLGLCIRCLRL